MSKQEIIDYLSKLIAEASEEPIDGLDENTSFFKIGVSSISALQIMNKLRKQLQVDINPVAMFEFKTLGEMSDYLLECIEEAQ